MGKLKNELLAQTQDDMGEPELSRDMFMQMFGSDPVAEFENIMTSAGFEVKPQPPSAFEVEKAYYEQWLWELGKYDDIHLIRELEDRGYDVRRAV